MSDELDAAIEQNAIGPARVSVDGTTVDGQDLSKQIEAARYLKSQQAAAHNHCGMRFVRLVTRRDS